MDKYKSIFRRLLGYIKKILGYCEGKTLDEFTADSMLADACLFNLCEIGETVRPYLSELNKRRPDVPWKHMRELQRQIMKMHEVIDTHLIWDIIQQDLTELRKKLENELQH